MNDEDKGVKDSKENEGSADPDNQPDAGDGVIAPGDIGKKADELLSNPPIPKDKRVVDADRFNEMNDKAKAFDAFAPIADKIKDKPEIIDNLLKFQGLEKKVTDIEEEAKARKRSELKDAVSYALGNWPGFESDWNEIREDTERLMKRGLNAKDAMRRSYLAMHPEAVQAEAERMAKEHGNRQGEFQGGGGYVPKPKLKNESVRELTPGERAMAQKLGKSEEEYGQLLNKHEGWLRARGFTDPALETPL